MSLSIGTSVVISCLDEPREILKTAESIRATATRDVEIIVVDDGSRQPIAPSPLFKLIRNDRTIGVGASRHIGVIAAKHECVLITDAHMRFCPGWDEAFEVVFDHPFLLICGQTLAMNEGDESWEQNHGLYHGARMVLRSPGEREARYRFLTPVWAPDRGTGIELYRLTAIMGALYGFRRDNFLKLGGLRMLRGFGGDEELLSIKWIRAGGEIRMSKKLRAGHKFRQGNRAPYRINTAELLANKLMIAQTCTPVGEEFAKMLGVGTDIRPVHDLLKPRWGEILCEWHYLDSIFKMDWDEYQALLKTIDG